MFRFTFHLRTAMDNVVKIPPLTDFCYMVYPCTPVHCHRCNKKPFPWCSDSALQPNANGFFLCKECRNSAVIVEGAQGNTGTLVTITSNSEKKDAHSLPRNVFGKLPLNGPYFHFQYCIEVAKQVVDQ